MKWVYNLEQKWNIYFQFFLKLKEFRGNSEKMSTIYKSAFITQLFESSLEGMEFHFNKFLKDFNNLKGKIDTDYENLNGNMSIWQEFKELTHFLEARLSIIFNLYEEVFYRLKKDDDHHKIRCVYDAILLDFRLNTPIYNPYIEQIFLYLDYPLIFHHRQEFTTLVKFPYYITNPVTNLYRLRFAALNYHEGYHVFINQFFENLCKSYSDFDALKENDRFYLDKLENLKLKIENKRYLQEYNSVLHQKQENSRKIIFCTELISNISHLLSEDSENKELAKYFGSMIEVYQNRLNTFSDFRSNWLIFAKEKVFDQNYISTNEDNLEIKSPRQINPIIEREKGQKILEEIECDLLSICYSSISFFLAFISELYEPMSEQAGSYEMESNMKFENKVIEHFEILLRITVMYDFLNYLGYSSFLENYLEDSVSFISINSAFWSNNQMFDLYTKYFRDYFWNKFFPYIKIIFDKTVVNIEQILNKPDLNIKELCLPSMRMDFSIFKERFMDQNIFEIDEQYRPVDYLIQYWYNKIVSTTPHTNTDIRCTSILMQKIENWYIKSINHSILGHLKLNQEKFYDY